MPGWLKFLAWLVPLGLSIAALVISLEANEIFSATVDADVALKGKPSAVVRTRHGKAEVEVSFVLKNIGQGEARHVEFEISPTRLPPEVASNPGAPCPEGPYVGQPRNSFLEKAEKVEPADVLIPVSALPREAKPGLTLSIKWENATGTKSQPQCFGVEFPAPAVVAITVPTRALAVRPKTSRRATTTP